MELDLRINIETALMILFLIAFLSFIVISSFNLIPVGYFWTFLAGLWIGIFLATSEWYKEKLKEALIIKENGNSKGKKSKK